MEGIVTKDEVLLKNETSPGSDGFKVDFDYFFPWNDIGSFLARSINETQKRQIIFASKEVFNYIAAK